MKKIYQLYFDFEKQIIMEQIIMDEKKIQIYNDVRKGLVSSGYFIVDSPTFSVIELIIETKNHPSNRQ